MPKWVWTLNGGTNIECSFFKPPHCLQGCTPDLPNMEDIVCKTTNSRRVHDWVWIVVYVLHSFDLPLLEPQLTNPVMGGFTFSETASVTTPAWFLPRDCCAGKWERESKKNNWSKKTYWTRMILVALVAHLVDEYYMLLVRLLAQVVREAPFSRRVRQVILRRLLSNPEPTWLTSEFIIL